MPDFLHVYISPKPGATPEQVEAKLNLAVDWIRYHDNNYVVYTTSDVDKWKERLSPLIKPDGSLFICRLDVDQRQGWMSRKFWDWLRAKKGAV